MNLARITAPHFVAGFTHNAKRVKWTAPIIRYMLGWPIKRVLEYCAKKKWRVELLD
jgi:hypothetical protein